MITQFTIQHSRVVDQGLLQNMMSDAHIPVITDRDVKYHLRDTNAKLVDILEKTFAPHQNQVQVSKGDIFSGAHPVDAVITPTNSFAFMEGGIDGRCRKYFGQQIQDRLQNVIQTKYNGELLVGQAVIIPAYEPESSKAKEEKAIKFVIASPTMRVVSDISATTNVYLCFRAALLAVSQHNRTEGNTPIKAVLVPGLGTGHGKMPQTRSAHQMLQAYETFVMESHPVRRVPETQETSNADHKKMCEA